MTPFELSRTLLLVLTTACFVTALFAVWHLRIANWSRRRDLSRAARRVIAETQGVCTAVRAMGIPGDLWQMVILYRGSGGELHLRYGAVRHPGARTEVLTDFCADLVSHSPHLKTCTLISTHCNNVSSEMTRSAKITGVPA